MNTNKNRTGDIIGYCRVSTPQQNIERQIRNIKAAYPDAVIVQDAYTGTTEERPGWQKVLREAEKGGISKIIFDSVSRMSRNAEDGIKTYMHLYLIGVQLEFLKEPQINTEVYQSSMDNALNLNADTGDEAADELLSGIGQAINRYMRALAKRQIELAFQQSQKEVDDLRQRTKEGMTTARLNGKQIGQRKGAKLIVKKRAAAKDKIRKYSKTFGGSLPDVEVIKLCGLSRNTYFKYKREIIQEMHSE